MTRPQRCLDTCTLRRLAVKGDVDPRSLKKVLAGKRVRGMAGYRAKLVLVEAGLLSEAKSVDASAEGHDITPRGSQNKP